jgi:iron(III) transport system substrate-binding protein
LAPSAAKAQGASLAELAMYSGPDRTQRLIAGAKREGMVSVYSSLTVDDMKVFGGAFEKKYGIKLQLWRSSSEDILQRAVVEARGGRFEVDAIETSAAEMESLHRDRLNLITTAYNTDLIKPAALPKTYDDLLDPRWKGKLGIEADDSIWFGALITALGEERGLKLFRDIARANGLSLRKGHTLLANLVVSGEVPFNLTAYQYKAEQLKKSGAPIEWYVVPPGIARFLGTGVLRRAPHPHAAILFLDFMLSDAQRLLLDRDFTPTNMKVKPLEIPFRVIDPALMLDEADKWSKLYDQIVVKQGRWRPSAHWRSRHFRNSWNSASRSACVGDAAGSSCSAGGRACGRCGFWTSAVSVTGWRATRGCRPLASSLRSSGRTGCRMRASLVVGSGCRVDPVKPSEEKNEPNGGCGGGSEAGCGSATSAVGARGSTRYQHLRSVA